MEYLSKRREELNLLLLQCSMYFTAEWVRFGALLTLPLAFVGTGEGKVEAS